jgi:hypothetical protein
LKPKKYVEKSIGIKTTSKEVIEKFELTGDTLLNETVILRDLKDKATDKTKCSKLLNENKTVLTGNKSSGFFLSCKSCKRKFLSTKELKYHKCLAIKVNKENLKLQPYFEVQEKASKLNEKVNNIKENIKTKEFSIIKSEPAQNNILAPKIISLIDRKLLNNDNLDEQITESILNNFLNIDNISEQNNIKEETGYSNYENMKEDQDIIDVLPTKNKLDLEINSRAINKVTNLAIDIKPCPGDSSIALLKKKKCCTICNITFSYRIELDSHCRNVHGNFRWSCSKCDNGFSTKIMLKRHTTRSGEQKFDCREGMRRTHKQMGKTFSGNFCDNFFCIQKEIKTS